MSFSASALSASLVFGLIFFPGQKIYAAPCTDMSGLISNGAYAVADTSGAMVKSCNADQQFAPASIIKIATVLAAMHALGPDYRFKTEVYSDAQANVYIKGYGDPMLVSEEVKLIVSELGNRLPQETGALFVDDSAFALEEPVPGAEATDNPYDAPVAALAVNFNAIAIAKDKTGAITSGEAQTPTLPLMRDLAANRAPGRIRVNICPGCVDERQMCARYAGELFVSLLRRQGIMTEGYEGIATVPADARLVLTHESARNLTEMSRSLLHSSSNFMANLIFLQIGAKHYGYPATWDKGRRAVRQELAALVGADELAALYMVDGSGLSREDQISARAMLVILQRFRPWRDILRQQGNGIFRKSGTLRGTYNLAGYLPNGRSYVILLNQQKNARDSVLAFLYPEGFPQQAKKIQTAKKNQNVQKKHRPAAARKAGAGASQKHLTRGKKKPAGKAGQKP